MTTDQRRCVGVAVIALVAVATGAGAKLPEGVFTVDSDPVAGTIDVAYDGTSVEWSIAPVPGGGSLIRVGGASQRGMPGEPVLPMFAVRIALPPDVDPGSVTAELTTQSVGALAAPVDPGWGRDVFVDVPDGEDEPSLAQLARTILDGRRSAEGMYPAEPFRLESVGRRRSWRYAECVVYPFAVDPDTGDVDRALSFSARIRFARTGTIPPYAAEDRSADGWAQSALLGVESVADLYGWSEDPPSNVLAIITRSALVAADSGITGYAAWLNAFGLSTIVVDDSDFGSYPGADPAEQARNWLIDQFQDRGIDYVLLIGDPRTDGATDLDPAVSLPMLEVYYNAGTDASPQRAHTDRWMADLNAAHDWDLDADGVAGEWVGDYILDEASPVLASGGLRPGSDVYVGRLSVYGATADDLADLRQYFTDARRWMTWGNEQPWRRRALIAAALLRFYDQRRSGGCDRACDDKADGSVNAEQIADDWWTPRGYDLVRYYEYGDNLDASYVTNTYYDYTRCPDSPAEYTMTYCEHPGDVSLGESNLVDRIRSGDQALMFWTGHGGYSGTSIYLWGDHVVNGIPEDGACTTNIYEVTSRRFIQRGDVADAAWPAKWRRFIALLASCNNAQVSHTGTTNRYSIAEALLSKYAVNVAAGTAPLWLVRDQSFDPDGLMIQEIAYRFADEITREPIATPMTRTVGHAFFEATDNVGRVEEADFANLLHLNLFGDPRLRLRYNLGDWDGVAAEVIPWETEEYPDVLADMRLLRDGLLRRNPTGRRVTDVIYRRAFELGTIISADPPLGPVVWDAVQPVLGIGMDFLAGRLEETSLALPPAVRDRVLGAIAAIEEEASPAFAKDLAFLRETALRMDGRTIAEVKTLYETRVEIEWAGTRMRLRWASEAGVEYAVERAGAPGGPWDEVGTVTVGGATANWPIEPATAPGFYRVRIRP